MRGHLIFAFLAELHRLDTRACVTGGPDGTGPLITSGYDPDFKEPVLVDRDDDGIGERVRYEHAPVLLPCQVESEAFDALQMHAAGNSPRFALQLVFHFSHL